MEPVKVTVVALASGYRDCQILNNATMKSGFLALPVLICTV